MGYRNPNGTYTDDQGKNWPSFAAANAAFQARQQQESRAKKLLDVRNDRDKLNNDIWSYQVTKNALGWIPGVGAASDRIMANKAKAKAAKQQELDRLRNPAGSPFLHPDLKGPNGNQVGSKVDPSKWPNGRNAPDETLASAGSSWTTHVTPAGTARESEARRMMQQYASKEYWDTEQGKAMKDLALQDKYKGDNLAGYYAAQQALGEGSIDEIIQGMGYTGAMAEWARANKGLALREYMKKFPAGQPTMGAGEPSAPTIDQAKPTVGEQALMNAKYALYDGAPVAPGVTIGNEAGAVAGLNRGMMRELQAIVPQKKSTGAGERAFNMQPESSAASWPGVLSANAGGMDFGKYNLPDTTETPEWMDWNKLVAAKKLELAGYDGKSLF